MPVYSGCLEFFSKIVPIVVHLWFSPGLGCDQFSKQLLLFVTPVLVAEHAFFDGQKTVINKYMLCETSGKDMVQAIKDIKKSKSKGFEEKAVNRVLLTTAEARKELTHGTQGLA